MRSKPVAVLDIRSAEITAAIGERGVNNTFIIKNKYTCAYDGFAEGELLDIPNFIQAVSEAVESLSSSLGGIKTFYVGVPGEFLKLVSADNSVSFQSSRKVTRADCENLMASAAPRNSDRWTKISRNCLYYVLSDKRKVIDPVGTVSDGLRGKFCYLMVNNAFLGCLMDAFKKFKTVVTVNPVPSNLMEAIYIIDEEKRYDCAVLFDLGYISSTYSVICGNGLLYTESFSVGIGHIAVLLSSELDIPFDVAMTFLKTVNLNAKDRLSSKEECVYDGQNYAVSTAILRDIIREGLDGICETVEECRQNFSGKIPEGQPIYITGEGVKAIRGAIDHISGRLVKNVEISAPKVPYYDKPQYSSLLSLLDWALRENSK